MFLKYSVFFIYILFSASGTILMKLSFNSKPLITIFGVGLSPVLFFGASAYIISFFLFIYILQSFNLSYIFPLATALVYVIIIGVSYFFLREDIRFLQMLGIIMIITGIVFVNIN